MQVSRESSIAHVLLDKMVHGVVREERPEGTGPTPCVDHQRDAECEHGGHNQQAPPSHELAPVQICAEGGGPHVPRRDAARVRMSHFRYA